MSTLSPVGLQSSNGMRMCACVYVCVCVCVLCACCMCMCVRGKYELEMCACVHACVCAYVRVCAWSVRTLSMHYTDMSTYQFIPYYASVYRRTHAFSNI